MDFEVEGVAGDILQSLNTLFSTPAGTLVFDREYGISLSSVDYPPAVAETMLAAEIAEKVSRYEPRANVDDIIFEDSGDGQILVRVVVSYANQEGLAS
jgi:phage baseplate assembly protein W